MAKANTGTTVKKVLLRIKRYWFFLILSILMAAVTVASSLYVPILIGNAIMLVIAGALFGWSSALYSIIFQFCSPQVIQVLYKRYKKETLFIISDYSEQIYKAIRETTNHDATLFQGIGCYEEKEKTLIYSVINTEAKRQLIPLIRSIDSHAFINIVKTEELAGRFHDIPND